MTQTGTQGSGGLTTTVDCWGGVEAFDMHQPRIGVNVGDQLAAGPPERVMSPYPSRPTLAVLPEFAGTAGIRQTREQRAWLRVFCAEQ